MADPPPPRKRRSGPSGPSVPEASRRQPLVQVRAPSAEVAEAWRTWAAKYRTAGEALEQLLRRAGALS